MVGHRNNWDCVTTGTDNPQWDYGQLAMPAVVILEIMISGHLLLSKRAAYGWADTWLTPKCWQNREKIRLQNYEPQNTHDYSRAVEEWYPILARAHKMEHKGFSNEW